MTLAAVDWASILIGAVVGAGLGVLLGLPAVSLFQPYVDRTVERARRGLDGHATAALPLDGIWRSSYEYTTAEQPELILVDEHFLEVRERRRALAAKSLPRATASALSLSLDIDGSVLTGTWREHTPTRREYHGACQFELNPTRDEARGVWLGFSRTRGVLSGTWVLRREGYALDRRTRSRYRDRADLAWRLPAPSSPDVSPTDESECIERPKSRLSKGNVRPSSGTDLQ